MKSFPKLFSPLFAVLLIVAGCLPAASIMAAEKAATVFLVRHAEKTNSAENPALSEAGQRRARELASVLRDAGITHIYSTDYIRTMDTANPLAELLMLEIELYDPGKLPEFAARLTNSGTRQLVVGHSNTTPELVALLGGEPGNEIDEPNEYDRLYVVTINNTGVSTVLVRYGAGCKN